MIYEIINWGRICKCKPSHKDICVWKDCHIITEWYEQKRWEGFLPLSWRNLRKELFYYIIIVFILYKLYNPDSTAKLTTGHAFNFITHPCIPTFSNPTTICKKRIYTPPGKNQVIFRQRNPKSQTPNSKRNPLPLEIFPSLCLPPTPMAPYTWGMRSWLR